MVGISRSLVQEVVPKGQTDSQLAALCEPPAFHKMLCLFCECGQAYALGSSRLNPVNEAGGTPLSLPVPVGMGEVQAHLPMDPLSEDETFTLEGSWFIERHARV